MKEMAYINPDGTVKAEIIAEQQASLAMSAQRHNVDPKLVDALMEEVNKHGYVIIPNLVSRELMNNIKAEITPLLTHDGRNEFEGHKTRRIYSVIEKTLALNPLLEHPLIMALLDRVLLPNYLLSQLQAINILPGETARELKETGQAAPRGYAEATVLFTDFSDFTSLASRMSPEEQTTLQGRMGEWAQLSPAQRTQARMNYDAAISFYQKSLGLLRMASRAPGRG